MDTRFKQHLKRSEFLVALVRAIRTGVLECHRVKWTLTRSRTIQSYLSLHRIRKLQIGAGPNFLKGWLNTDLYPQSDEAVFLDATKSFPFADETFDYVFSEHVIEHLAYNDGLFMLRECCRVLKPGGRIRLATPNLEILIALNTPERSDPQQRYIKWAVDKYLSEIGVYRAPFVINNAFRNWGHQFLYDRETLQSAMAEVGFIDVTCAAPGKSDDENLQGVEFRTEEMDRFETMVLEAKRPKQN